MNELEPLIFNEDEYKKLLDAIKNPEQPTQKLIDAINRYKKLPTQPDDHEN